MDLSSLDKFINDINVIRSCDTPGCRGKLIPTTSFKTIGRGTGAISVYYTCDGCVAKHVQVVNMTGWAACLAVQVAFIATGCTYVTYHKTLQMLGINGVCPQSFQYTLEVMHPIVKQMLDEMCNEAKKKMCDMDQNELGSWSRAVTSADGTWQTRGFHSKNATFSIRNYFSGVCFIINTLVSDVVIPSSKKSCTRALQKVLRVSQPSILSREQRKKACSWRSTFRTMTHHPPMQSLSISPLQR